MLSSIYCLFFALSSLAFSVCPSPGILCILCTLSPTAGRHWHKTKQNGKPIVMIAFALFWQAGRKAKARAPLTRIQASCLALV